jgi:hypothetical protein
MPIGRSDYEDRKEQRINSLERKAAKANMEANRADKKAHSLAGVLPFGQPILVGHHSEKAHRSLIDKTERAHRKSMEEHEKAAYYLDKAEAASNNRAISGDNPEAMKLYQEKLKNLEAAQERVKAINKAFLKGDEALKALGLTGEQIAKMKSNMQPYERLPYPAWTLSNNSAEIRRVKAKIESLTRLDQMAAEIITFSGGEMRNSVDINRVQFRFDDIPPPQARTLLKNNGFRWAPSEKAWQRQRTLNGIRVARRLVSKLEKILSEV